VGQTKRKIKTRIKKHAKNIKSDPSRQSVVSEHIRGQNYNFDWSNLKIFDTEYNYQKVIHIKYQREGINL